jgi:hypothetical protein
MKKLATVLAATVMLLSASAFTKESNDTKATTKVEKSFKTDFSKAENATWRKIGDVFIANFLLDDVELEAAYNSDGELVGTLKKVQAQDLPLAVNLAIAKKYNGYEVAKKAEEITFEKQTSYYINVSNGKEILKLKCSVNGELTVDKKTRI